MLKQTIGFICIVLLITTLILALIRRVDWIAFWVVAGCTYLVAKFALPKLNQ